MKIHLLHWGRAWEEQSAAIRSHSHPYCQFEICVSGTLCAAFPGRSVELKQGECILVPPMVEHRIGPVNTMFEFYSLKFISGKTPDKPVVLSQSRFTEWMLQSLRSCHAQHEKFLLPINSNREVIEPLLQLVMERVLSKPQAKEKMQSELFGKIEDIAMSRCACINAKTCAEEMGMTPSHLNYLFSVELKKLSLSPAEWSVKKIIDRALLYQIERFLDYTDFPIMVIAEKMHFNNVYTFSRFYKRLSGIPPKARRGKTSGTRNVRTSEAGKSQSR